MCKIANVLYTFGLEKADFGIWNIWIVGEMETFGVRKALEGIGLRIGEKENIVEIFEGKLLIFK